MSTSYFSVMTQFAAGFMVLLIGTLFPSKTWAIENNVENSVVRIINYQQQPNWYSPWKMQTTATGTGSGFLIGNQWILTNAHVVSDSRLLLVNKLSTPKPFIADVVAIAHDSDLALLKTRDPTFYEDMTPLKFGSIPELQSRVRAYGYPVGGQKISRTEGVVSRIEFGTYVHPGIDSHLLVQTDSAINPGNSGGPVIQNERVVGVAFQSNPNLNDVGYFIPISLIQRFLDDIKDGHYDGVPEIGVQASSLLNPYQRQFLKLPEGIEGVLVDRVLPLSSVENILSPGDVIVSLEGQSVDLAGLVNYEGQRVSFFIGAENKQVGDSIDLRFWRNPKFHDVTVSLKPPPYSQEMRNSYDSLPEYFILGGLVFAPLNRNYFNTSGELSPALMYEHWYREVEKPGTRREQVVLLTRVLPATVNSGYASIKNIVLDRVNGIQIQSLKHLKEVVLSLLKEEYYIFESQWMPTPIVLDRKRSEQEQPSILKRYGIEQAERFNP